MSKSITWQGRPVAECSREQLLECVEHLALQIPETPVPLAQLEGQAVSELADGAAPYWTSKVPRRLLWWPLECLFSPVSPATCCGWRGKAGELQKHNPFS